MAGALVQEMKQPRWEETAYEEAMDLTCYLRQLIAERNDPSLMDDKSRPRSGPGRWPCGRAGGRITGLAKYLIRHERHPDDPDKLGGWE